MSDYVEELKAQGKTCGDCDSYESCDNNSGLCDFFESDDSKGFWQISYSELMRFVLEDYGFDTSSTPPIVLKHLVEDFMDAMVRHGHVMVNEKVENDIR